MNASTLGIASDFVKAGVVKAGIPLTQTLEHYLTITFARFIGNAITAYCKNVHMQDAELLGRLAQYAILTFVILIALDQVNIGGDIVRQARAA